MIKKPKTTFLTVIFVFLGSLWCSALNFHDAAFLHEIQKCFYSESFSWIQSFMGISRNAACISQVLTAPGPLFVPVLLGLCLLEAGELLILLLAALLPQQQLWMERSRSWPALHLVWCGRNHRWVSRGVTSCSVWEWKTVNAAWAVVFSGIYLFTECGKSLGLYVAAWLFCS